MKNEVLTTEFMEIAKMLNRSRREILLARLKDLLQNQKLVDDCEHLKD